MSNFTFSPVYVVYCGGYAHDYKKNHKPIIRYDRSYIYIKYGDEVYKGTEPETGRVFQGEQGEGILGVQFDGGGKVSIGMYLGYGTLTAILLTRPANIKSNYITNSKLDDEFFKCGVNVKIRLY